jgi:hypothetical protein
MGNWQLRQRVREASFKVPQWGHSTSGCRLGVGLMRTS